MAQERKSSDKIWVNINNITEEKSLEVLGDFTTYNLAIEFTVQ